MTPLTAPYAGHSAWWAVLRWLWAFDPNSTRLRISSEALNLRFHNRQAFSEALGIAASRIFTERGYRAMYGAVASLRFVDADASIAARAIADPVLKGAAPSVFKISGLSPDYIAFHLTSGGVGDPRAIECKGEHSDAVNGPPRAVLEQLADARLQGPSLRVGGRPLQESWLFCAAVATHKSPGDWGCGPVQEGEIRVFALDPEGGGVDEPPPNGERAVWQRTDRGWSIADWERFAEDLLDLDRAGLLAWAGDDEGARASSPLTRAQRPSDMPSLPTMPGSRRDATGEFFDGTEMRIELPGGVSLCLFLGVDREVLAAARRSRRSDLAAATHAFNSRMPSIDTTTGPVNDEGVGDSARAVASDGTMLEVAVRTRD